MPISELWNAEFIRRMFVRRPSDEELIREVATAIDRLPNPSNRDSAVKLVQEMLAAREISLAIDCLRTEYEEREIDSQELKATIQRLIDKNIDALDTLFQCKYEGFGDS